MFGSREASEGVYYCNKYYESTNGFLIATSKYLNDHHTYVHMYVCSYTGTCVGVCPRAILTLFTNDRAGNL